MLNPQQMAAVTYIGGPLLVLAGAGTGKTRVITQKVVYLLEQCQYAPKTIYAITFTNKAVNEMRTRIATAISAPKRHGLKIETFHTLGLSIIRENTKQCGLRPGFSIFDSDDCQLLLKSYLPLGKANERAYLLQIQQQISRWKNDLLRPNDVKKNDEDESIFSEALSLYPHYQQALKTYNAVDFDDLIFLAVTLLQESPLTREHWQHKIRYLLVDEYQDSNASQYRLVKLLTGERAQFTVVGDDDQSIYAWRGAKPENLKQLSQDYPQLKIIKLEQNYRSTGCILHVANALITKNSHLFAKKLWSELGFGEPLRVIYCKEEYDEAEQVVADLISQKLRFGRQYGEFAILYRSNHQSRLFEKVLRQQGISYHLSGGQSWFGRSEIKDIFAYLRLLSNPDDDAAFLRAINTPKRGVGEATLEVLGQYAQARGQSLFYCSDHLALSNQINEKPRAVLQFFKHQLLSIQQRLITQPPREVLRDLIEFVGYETYLYEQSTTPAKAQKSMENVWELIEWVSRLLNEDEKTLADVINKLILIDILDKTENNTQTHLQLLTLHAAKGLEFPHVYLVGMEEELLPHRSSIETNQIEEERRLAYVGITRAQKTLCITLAKKRRREGSLQDCEPSRFLEELPQENIEYFGKGEILDENKAKAFAKAHLMGLKNLLGESKT